MSRPTGGEDAGAAPAAAAAAAEASAAAKASNCRCSSAERSMSLNMPARAAGGGAWRRSPSPPAPHRPTRTLELGSRALGLEARDHGPLQVRTRALAQEQALGEVLRGGGVVGVWVGVGVWAPGGACQAPPHPHARTFLYRTPLEPLSPPPHRRTRLLVERLEHVLAMDAAEEGHR